MGYSSTDGRYIAVIGWSLSDDLLHTMFFFNMKFLNLPVSSIRCLISEMCGSIFWRYISDSNDNFLFCNKSAARRCDRSSGVIGT